MSEPSINGEHIPPHVGRRQRRSGRAVRTVVWLVVLALVAGGGFWYWRGHAKPQQGAQAVPQGAGRFATSGPQPVGAATIQKGDIAVTLNELGTVTPLATVTVQTQINGQLMELGFKDGQLVNKGDFIAQIDPRPYQAALEQAQGQLLHDQALLKEAQIDLARYQKLAAQNSIARQQADDQEYLARQYEGTVKVDQAAVDTAKLNLAYCHIVSPVSGRAGIRQVDPGNYVQTSSSTGIVVITQTKPITVIFPLPEDNLPAVLKRLRAGAKLEVTAYDRTGSTKLATGTLVAVDSQINTTTGTVNLRAEFANDDESLFPNQFVNVTLLLDTMKDVVVAPSAAIQRGAPGTFVYLIGPDLKVSVRAVKLGPSQGERVAVLSGLNPGDSVVVDGADRLRDGAKVTVPATAKAQADTPAAGQAGGSADQPADKAAGKKHRKSDQTDP